MYFATVRLKGISVNTAVYADNSLHARLILEFQFGIGCVVSALALTKKTNEHYKMLDEVVAAIKPIKPLTPQKVRIDTLKKQKDLASKNLKAERDRQRIDKAQQQIRAVTANTILP
jgi:hypothetical protein